MSYSPAVKLIDPAGVPYGVKQVDGKPRVSSIPYTYDITVGTANAAAGNITVHKTGTAATVYSRIPIGRNTGLSTARMVPAGKTLYIIGGDTSAADKSINAVLASTSHCGILIPGVFIAHGSWFLNNSSVSRLIGMPIVIPELAIVKLIAYVPAGKAGGDVAATWEGWIE